MASAVGNTSSSNDAALLQLHFVHHRQSSRSRDNHESSAVPGCYFLDRHRRVANSRRNRFEGFFGATAVAPPRHLDAASLRIPASVLHPTVECLQACDALERSHNGACVVSQTVDRDAVGVGRVVDQDTYSGRVALRRLCKLW